MKIAPHFNHNIEIAKYSDGNGNAVNYSVECIDCFEVIFDEDVL
jgi:hypothetical protein